MKNNVKLRLPGITYVSFAVTIHQQVLLIVPDGTESKEVRNEETVISHDHKVGHEAGGSLDHANLKVSTVEHLSSDQMVSASTWLFQETHSFRIIHHKSTFTLPFASLCHFRPSRKQVR